MVVKDEIKVKHILAIDDQVQQGMNEILKDTEQAIQISTYIRIELEKQIEALDQLEDENKELPEPLKLRIGIASGPVVAGVIGQNKFIYDLWGETVNTASRMESSGVAGEIHITASTKEALGDAAEYIDRGEIEIKGIGKMTTYLARPLT